MEAPRAPRPIWDRLLTIPRPVVFLIIVIAVVVPFLRPLGLKVEPSETTRQLYTFVDGLRPGSVVVIAFDYAPASMAELQPMALALTRHCFAKDLKVVALGFDPAGIPLADVALAKAAQEYDKKLYEDYVNLGYKPAMGPAVQQMGVDIHKTYAQDARKTPIGDIPLMRNVRNYDDVAIIIDLCSSATPQVWIQFAHTGFDATISAGVTAVMAVDMYQYIQAGQLVGLLGGLRGAAEYEKLVGRPEFGTLGMDSQALSHSAIILLVLLANLAYFVKRRRGEVR
jgi:hypothetical protein